MALGVFSTVVPTLAFFRLIGFAGAAFTSQMNYLIPAWGFFIGVAVMGEPLRLSALAALALLVAGMVVSGWQPARLGTRVRRT